MKRFRGIAILSLVVAGWWIVWYPPAIAIEDEAAYLAHARILARGRLAGDRPADRTVSMVETARGAVAKFPPGQAVLLAPTQLGPWQAAFAIPLLALLGTTWLGALALARDGRSPLWAALILLHPTLLLYARTIMSDVTLACCLTAGFVLADERRPQPWWAGMAYGTAALIRTAGIPIAAALGLHLVWRLARRGRRREVAQAVAGALVPLAALVLYRVFVFGSPVAAGTAVGSYFDWGASPGRALFYLAALNLVWPLMALGVVRSEHHRRAEARLVLGISFVFFSAYYFVDRRFGLPADFVVGLRFFVPILPILVYVYAERVEAWLSRLPARSTVYAAGLGVILAADVALVARHQQFLTETSTRRELAVRMAQRADAVILHGSAAELLSPAWDAPPFILAGGIDDLLARLPSAADSQTVFFAAQGAAGDSLARRAEANVQVLSDLTFGHIGPTETSRR